VLPRSAADDELYQRAVVGDENSLDALLARYLPQLHTYVHARLSSDVRARESSMDALASLSEDHREVLTLARIVDLPTR
jgi:DNA-directed RNA polymerase specialized sigma24 family protein